MSPIVIIAAAAVAGSIALLLWSLLSTRTARSQVSSNLGTRLDPGPVRTGSSEASPVVEKLAGQARRWLPGHQVGRLERSIAEAGRSYNLSVDQVLAMKGIGLLALAAAGGAIWLAGPSLGKLLLWVGLAFLGFFLPDLYLLNLAQHRRQEIELALPDTLDQMTIAVQAGLGFDAAMLRVARSNSGPLAQEFAIVQHETRLGVSRTQALRRLGTRSGCTDLRRFVSAIVQSESYGIPIADILIVQAGELREKRRQRAEERAMKIPVKIIFPVILCILPSLFVVLLGPAAIRIMRDLL